MLLRRVFIFFGIGFSAAAALAQNATIDFETARLERRLVAKRASGTIDIDAFLVYTATGG